MEQEGERRRSITADSFESFCSVPPFDRRREPDHREHYIHIINGLLDERVRTRQKFQFRAGIELLRNNSNVRHAKPTGNSDTNTRTFFKYKLSSYSKHEEKILKPCQSTLLPEASLRSRGC